MKKRIFALAVIFAMLAGLVPGSVLASPVTAVRSSHTVHVDGVPVAISAFNINGHNFFMLRDVAGILRDTDSRFGVSWDAYRSAIGLATGVAAPPPEVQSLAATQTATESNDAVYVDGTRVNLRAYNIAGRNYFMLRDLGSALGFIVDWDATANAVLINTGGVQQVPPTPQPTPASTPQPVQTPAPTPEPTSEPQPTAAPPAASGISAADYVRSIGPGWNLGNQFDAHNENALGWPWLGTGRSYETASVTVMETAWQGGASNVVTRDFLQRLNNAGFTAIRIPVTWYKVALGPDYTIRADWMARIREVVQWAYDLDMHIILNTHHENNFKTHESIQSIGLTDAEIEHSIHVLTRFWEQIAPEFNGFGDRLMFAGLNEPRTPQGEWDGGVPETRANLNRLNQAFVDTVRATGGNNANRFLLVPTHAASADNRAFDGFTIPRDTATDRIIMAIHTYSPFAWAHDGRGSYTGPDRIRRDLNRVDGFARQLGVPVILSEWGSINNGAADNLTQREQHAYDYVTIAREFGMATFWWDSNVSKSTGDLPFGLINRRTGEIEFPTIVDAIMRASR
ncbi:MAG: cellulase family glycosylhydrolase [Defluviitaleaceae bacterium]|nr:cellulase family glycosylhydrolase [Defluviitaleaceae bacterium]